VGAWRWRGAGACELGSTRMTVRKWRGGGSLRMAWWADQVSHQVADLVLTGTERDQLSR
jgi:hypothetical protein